MLSQRAHAPPEPFHNMASLDCTDLAVARLQLAELQQRCQCIVDSRLALKLFLEDAGQEGEDIAGVDLSEEQFLREQIGNLTVVINNLQSEAAASRIQAEERASIEAARMLAACLETRQQWDDRLCAHDAAFARELSFCSSEEWEEVGDLISRPIHVAPRPQSPGELGSFPQGDPPSFSCMPAIAMLTMLIKLLHVVMSFSL